jgi:hypothetical protein
MELSGNLLELPISIGKAKGRAFTGTNGDGLLDSNGDANADTWPGYDANGVGWRGGSFDHGSNDMRVSDRTYASQTYPNRYELLGFRAVRR